MGCLCIGADLLNRWSIKHFTLFKIIKAETKKNIIWKTKNERCEQAVGASSITTSHIKAIIFFFFYFFLIFYKWWHCYMNLFITAMNTQLSYTFMQDTFHIKCSPFFFKNWTMYIMVNTDIVDSFTADV